MRFQELANTWFGKLGALLISLALVGVVAGFASQFRPGDWYGALEKPPFTPPDWLFAPVWTVLYLMMAVAAWLVWLQRDRPFARAALALYGAQLILNGLWSWLFFGQQLIGAATLEIAALLIVLAACTLCVRLVHRGASLLMTPYLAWVGFAGLLNAAIWRLNA